MASPVADAYSCASGARIAGGRFAGTSVPWAPVAGQIKNISYATGTHPNGVHGGAVLSEINTAYQSWNPHNDFPALYPTEGPWCDSVIGYYFSSVTAYGGMSLNPDTRQLTGYGGGHAASCVTAPWTFDLNDLTWKWLASAIPSDGMKTPARAGYSAPFSQAVTEMFYPPEQYDYTWGDWNGDWSGWPAGYAQPGKIFPECGHSRGLLIHVPGSSFGNTKGVLLKTDAPSGEMGGTNARSSHLFNYDTGSWERTTNNHVDFTVASTGGISSVYDAVTNKILIALGSTVSVLDVPTRTWSTKTASNSFTMAVDNGTHNLHLASRLYMAMIRCTVDGSTAANGSDSGGNGVKYRINAAHVDDILSGTFSWTTLNLTASSWPLRTTGSNFTIGWAYCPINGCFYCVNGCNGSTSLWKLSPPVGATTKAAYLAGTWTITEEAMSGGSLNAPGNSMVYNRLQWDVLSRSFIWTSSNASGAVQAIRPQGV